MDVHFESCCVLPSSCRPLQGPLQLTERRLPVQDVRPFSCSAHEMWAWCRQLEALSRQGSHRRRSRDVLGLWEVPPSAALQHPLLVQAHVRSFVAE